MVRQFISKCVICRYLRGSHGEQKMADLPSSGVEPATPFTYCGVRRLWSLACPARKICRQKIWSLVYLLGKRGSAYRSSGFPRG